MAIIYNPVVHPHDAQELARELMRRHGLFDAGWRFRFDHARRRFGCCRYGPKLITLSRPLTLLYVLSLAFIVANLGMGLFISTAVKSQVQAMQLGFFFLLPNILLSGFMFPREAMPVAAQWIGLALPLTYFLDVVRGVLLKGVGFEYLWKEALIMSLFAIGSIAVSVRRFQKTLG